jgi:hypothetical protein
MCVCVCVCVCVFAKKKPRQQLPRSLVLCTSPCPLPPTFVGKREAEDNLHIEALGQLEGEMRAWRS